MNEWKRGKLKRLVSGFGDKRRERWEPPASNSIFWRLFLDSVLAMFLSLFFFFFAFFFVLFFYVIIIIMWSLIFDLML